MASDDRNGRMRANSLTWNAMRAVYLLGALPSSRSHDQDAAFAIPPRVLFSLRASDAAEACAVRWRTRDPDKHGSLEPPRAVLWLDHREGLLCAAGSAHGGRAQLTALMVELALGEAAREARAIPDFTLVFDLNDHSCRGDLVYARCPSCPERRPDYGQPCASLLAPDYTLLSWRTAGVDSFAREADSFEAAGRRPATGRRVCGWAGSLESNIARRLFAREVLACNGSVLEALRRCARLAPRAREATKTGLACAPELGQVEQIMRWPCVIDLPGWGYSGRLPLLLRSGRPLLFVVRPIETWYRDASQRGALLPWSHFVPVAVGHQNIMKRAKTLLGRNYSAALGMAARAQGFARRVLSLRTAVRYLMFQILRAARAPGLPAHAEVLEAAADGASESGAGGPIALASASGFAQLVARWPHLFPRGPEAYDNVEIQLAPPGGPRHVR
jgi:uncharacterized protein (DUF2237 family)